MYGHCRSWGPLLKLRPLSKLGPLLKLGSTVKGRVNCRSQAHCRRQGYHGILNYIDTKAKCRHLKKLICKGTLWQVFIRVYRLEIKSVMLVFRPSFVNCCPSNLFSGSTLALYPPPCLKVHYTQIVCGWEEIGGVGDHILQEFNTLYLTRFSPYKTDRPLQTKNLGGEGDSDR